MVLLAVTGLVLAGCGGDDGDVRRNGEAAIQAIELPAAWKRTEQKFTAAGWQRSENEWYQVWDIDPPMTVRDAKPVFDAAATDAGWTKLGDDGRWSKSAYWMRASIGDVPCPQQSRCAQLRLTVVDVKPPWG